MSQLTLFSLDAESDLPSPHFLIRASAGTGKTYRLSSHYLKLLFQGAEPESILATTFTKKAAGEIFDRVVWRLAEAVRHDDKRRDLARSVDIVNLSPQECVAQLARLTRQLHRVRISTLDAFFVQIADSFALELGLPPGWSVAHSEDELTELCEQAMARLLEASEVQALLTLVHQIFPKGSTKRTITRSLIESAQSAYEIFLDSDPQAWDKVPVFQPLSADVLEEYLARLRAHSLPQKLLANARDRTCEAIRTENWENFAGSGLGRPAVYEDWVFRHVELDHELRTLLRPIAKHVRAVVMQRLRQQTRAMFQLLQQFDERLQWLKQESRIQEFGDLTRKLAAESEKLGHQAMAFRLDSATQHLLLDEFQDTSPRQWQVLQPLLERIAGPQAAADNSLLCVGDTKQAIYGWRGGSALIFDVMNQELPRLNNEVLGQSYRSSAVIMEAVNKVFQTEIDSGTLGRLAPTLQWFRDNYPTHSTAKTDLPGYVTLEVVRLHDDEADDPAPDSGSARGEAGSRRFAEGDDGNEADDDATESATDLPVQRRAAEYIAQLAKTAPGRTIGVLCRTNQAVGQMMQRLRQLGLSASEEGGNAITDSAAVQLVLSLLRLADHPHDTVAAFHLAASPWGAAWRFVQPADRDEVQTRLRRQAAVVARQVRCEILAAGFGEMIRGWTRQLHPFCDAREWKRLGQLVEVAYGYQRQFAQPRDVGYSVQRRRSFRTSEFVRYVRAQKVADSSPDPVRVMTVHKAKGLEFDIVVLPDLDKNIFGRNHSGLHARKPTILDKADLVFRHFPQDFAPLVPAEWHDVIAATDARTASDALCVLYVALTRAVHGLHMFVAGPGKTKKGTKSISTSFAGLLCATLGKERLVKNEIAETGVFYEAGDAGWMLARSGDSGGGTPGFTTAPGAARDRPPPGLPATAPIAGAASRRVRRGLETVAPSSLEGGGQVRLGDRLRRQPRLGMQYGSLIHAWFEQLAWLPPPPGDAVRGDAVPGDAAPGKGMAESAETPLSDGQLRRIATALELENVDVGRAIRDFRHMLGNATIRALLDRERYAAELLARLPKRVREQAWGTAAVTVQGDASRQWPAGLELQVRNEQPVVTKLDGQIMAGTIDRLVLIRRDQNLLAADILDYKTDAIDPRDTASWAAKIDFYRPQLLAYRRAVSKMLRLDLPSVSARLLFVGNGQLATVAEWGSED